MLSRDLTDHAHIQRAPRALTVKVNMLARGYVRCSERVKITVPGGCCTLLSFL